MVAIRRDGWSEERHLKVADGHPSVLAKNVTGLACDLSNMRSFYYFNTPMDLT